MSARARIAAAALAAVGTRYRPAGRDPAYGLDCVGLVALSLRAGGCDDAVPAGYGLRGGTADSVARLIDRAALVRIAIPQAGDLMLFAVGPAQFHLAIRTAGGLVHADAMLRRVVERPGVAPWPMIAAWRLDDEGEA